VAGIVGVAAGPVTDMEDDQALVVEMVGEPRGGYDQRILGGGKGKCGEKSIEHGGLD
jgi:hypothetical protein